MLIWMERWFTAAGSWLVIVAIGLAVQGVIAGVMVAWRTVHGDSIVTAHRGTISRGVGLAAAAIASPILLPGWAAAPTVGRLALIASAIGVVALALPWTRALGYAVLLASISTGALISMLAFFRSAGVRVPFLWVAPIGLACWIMSALSGAWVGFAIDDAPAGRLPNAAKRLTESAQKIDGVLSPMERLVFKWTLLGGFGLALVIGVWAGMTNHQREFLPFLVVLAPVTVVFIWMMFRGVLLFWARVTLGLYVVVLASVSMVRDMMRGMVQPGMILARFPKALCDSCLRWSKPLDSGYDVGVRTCEKCGGEISYDGGAGRLVALVGETYAPPSLPKRVFVRLSDQITDWEGQLDVTHVRLPKNAEYVREFENLVTWLLNEPPSHGLGKIAVYSPIPRSELPANVRNLIQDTFSWAEHDPCTESKLA